uniref:Uncharacterized protein n=1 Tax=viral metagenome TaxID=1070528 RepID=A0A6C0C9M6_9ZZZZ
MIHKKTQTSDSSRTQNCSQKKICNSSCKKQIQHREQVRLECEPKDDKVIVYFDFAKITIATLDANFTNALPNFIPFPLDGTTTIDSNGLFVNAPQFVSTIPTGNEHVKNLRYYKNPFILSDDYETLYETEIAVDQYIPINNIPSGFLPRIRNIYEDIRLCSGAINTIDPETFLVTDIFLSRDKIYCFVERLPFGQSNTNFYAAYSAAFPAGGRGGNAANDFVKVGIGLQKTSAKYYINDELVFTVPRFGVRQNDPLRMLDHKGVAEATSMSSSYFGFGLFSLLDMQLPNNYARQLVENEIPIVTTYPDSGNQSASGLVQLDVTNNYGEILPGKYNDDNRPIIDQAVTWAYPYIAPSIGNPDPNHDVKLFGQGAGLRMKYFKVSVRCI